MKLPRDLAGEKLSSSLRRYGYQVSRQTGSHLRLTSFTKGTQHHVTIPAHKELRLGTLHSILSDIASYLEIELETLIEELFGQ